MIIETLTAFTSVKIVWETLEILHMVHVGHITGKASYKGGNALKHAIQQQQLKWQDQKNPVLQLEREAKTLYDFQATGDTVQAIHNIKNEAQAYLKKLKDSVDNLKKSKDYFVAIYTNLTELVHALTFEGNGQFSSHLLEFKSNFESFKDEFNQFSLSIEPPPRQLLYIADLISETPINEQYNDRLKTIKAYVDLLEETKQKITEKFKQGFDIIPTLLTSINSNSDFSFEQLQQDIEQCIKDPDQIAETMGMILPNNTQLATICTDIIQISLAFKQNNKIEPKIEQINQFEHNPNWLPLLTEGEQIETGQRIILHAMNEAVHSEEEKLFIAQIFLRQHVSKFVINQIEVNLLSHEMACIMRSWQIKKCEQLIQFLNILTQGSLLPHSDLDGLLVWLKTKRKIQSPIALFTEILVLPCFFKQCSIESALTKFKHLAPDENANLIKQHLDSHWGEIWDKNDTLIQLPKSFATSILPRNRRESEDQSQNSNIVSSIVQKLATALTVDLKRLKGELEDNLFNYLDVKLSFFHKELNEASESQKKQEREMGISRIRKAHRYLHSITSSSNSLFPYLYHDETINVTDKKRQVPSADDLLHLIYRGVDPNGICFWKSSSSQPYSQSNQLLYYFFPNYQNDSRTKAWVYACTDCQVNAVPIFSHLFSPNDRPLALGNTPGAQLAIKNSLSIQAILKDPTEISSIATHSKALNGVAAKSAEETETVFQELKNYLVLALVRVNPEYRNKLPLKKQFECLFKNFFKFGQEIGEERLESVQLYIGDLCAVLSAEDINAINKALDDLKKNHENRFKQAQKADRSTLYTIMKKAFDGPISSIIKQVNEVYQSDFKEEEEKLKLKEKVKRLKETINKMEIDNAELNAQLKISEAKRVQDKTETSLELAQYKAEIDEKMKTVTDFLDYIKSQETASTSCVSNEDIPRNVRFFKH